MPDDPDPDDSTGLSSDEFELVVEHLEALGAENVKVEKKASA